MHLCLRHRATARWKLAQALHAQRRVLHLPAGRHRIPEVADAAVENAIRQRFGGAGFHVRPPCFARRPGRHLGLEGGHGPGFAFSRAEGLRVERVDHLLEGFRRRRRTPFPARRPARFVGRRRGRAVLPDDVVDPAPASPMVPLPATLLGCVACQASERIEVHRVVSSGSCRVDLDFIAHHPDREHFEIAAGLAAQVLLPLGMSNTALCNGHSTSQPSTKPLREQRWRGRCPSMACRVPSTSCTPIGQPPTLTESGCSVRLRCAWRRWSSFPCGIPSRAPRGQLVEVAARPESRARSGRCRWRATCAPRARRDRC